MKTFGKLALRFILVLVGVKVTFMLADLIGGWITGEADVSLFLLPVLLPGPIAAVAAAGISWTQRVAVWLLPAGVGCAVQVLLFHLHGIVYTEANPFPAACLLYLAQSAAMTAAWLTAYFTLRQLFRRQRLSEPASGQTDGMSPAANPPARWQVMIAMAVMAPVVVAAAGISVPMLALSVLFYASVGASLIWLPAFWLPAYQRWIGGGTSVTVTVLVYVFLMNTAPAAWFNPVVLPSGLFLMRSQICFLTALVFSASVVSVMVIRQYAPAKPLAQKPASADGVS